MGTTRSRKAITTSPSSTRANRSANASSCTARCSTRTTSPCPEPRSSWPRMATCPVGLEVHGFSVSVLGISRSDTRYGKPSNRNGSVRSIPASVPCCAIAVLASSAGGAVTNDGEPTLTQSRIIRSAAMLWITTSLRSGWIAAGRPWIGAKSVGNEATTWPVLASTTSVGVSVPAPPPGSPVPAPRTRCTRSSETASTERSRPTPLVGARTPVAVSSVAIAPTVLRERTEPTCVPSLEYLTHERNRRSRRLTPAPSPVVEPG